MQLVIPLYFALDRLKRGLPLGRGIWIIQGYAADLTDEQVAELKADAQERGQTDKSDRYSLKLKRSAKMTLNIIAKTEGRS